MDITDFANAWTASGVSVTSGAALKVDKPKIIISQKGKQLVNSNEFPEDIQIRYHKGKAWDITLFGETIEHKSVRSISMATDYSWSIGEELANDSLSTIKINLKPKLSPAQEQVVANVIMQINL